MSVEQHREGVHSSSVRGDSIAVGNVEHSFVAIGAGASVIVKQVQQALSAVDEMERSIRLAERELAEAIQLKIARYLRLLDARDRDERENPYKALLSYNIEDAPFFFGRSQPIAGMMAKVRHERLTVLHSKSGSGKTSLLQAGLASRLLAGGAFPLYVRAYNVQPDTAIKQSFLRDYATRPDLERFQDEHMSLAGFLERVTYYLGGRTLVIFLDQFEEFFTELAPDQRKSFVGQLQPCIESDLQVHWVLALRKEYFSDLRIFGAMKPYENAYFLPAFDEDEARQAIVEPARRSGISYEGGLVERIFKDLAHGTERVAPVQVQLVCHRLFEEAASRGAPAITLSQYEQRRGRGEGLPGAQGILSSHLSDVLDNQLAAQDRMVATGLLEELVTSDGRRVVRPVSVLQKRLPENPQLLERVLNVLYENRLLRREVVENDEFSYELAHEYLISEIALHPQTQSRKLAREMLDIDLLVYVRNLPEQELLIAEDRLIIIERYLGAASLSAAERQLVEKSRLQIDAERREESERLQREILTQTQLVWRTRFFLIVAVLAAFLLALTPFSNEVRRWQAREQSSLVPMGGMAIEKREVSNFQYRLCVEAGACTVPNSRTFAEPSGASDMQAVSGVDALQASAYCQWVGRQLPTEAEWLAALTLEDVEQMEAGISEWTRTYSTSSGSSPAQWDGVPENLSFEHFLIARGASDLDSSDYVPANGREDDQIFGIRCLAHKGE